MKLKCLGCGETFESLRRSTKCCSDKCRKAVWRRDKHRGKHRGSQDTAPAGATGGPGLVRISDVTLRRLDSAGRVETPLGQLALRLALRIDVGGDESGSAIAALSKELRATLGAALAGATREGGDAVDDLRERREAKQRGA